MAVLSVDTNICDTWPLECELINTRPTFVKSTLKKRKCTLVIHVSCCRGTLSNSMRYWSLFSGQLERVHHQVREQYTQTYRLFPYRFGWGGSGVPNTTGRPRTGSRSIVRGAAGSTQRRSLQLMAHNFYSTATRRKTYNREWTWNTNNNSQQYVLHIL